MLPRRRPAYRLSPAAPARRKGGRDMTKLAFQRFVYDMLLFFRDVTLL